MQGGGARVLLSRGFQSQGGGQTQQEKAACPGPEPPLAAARGGPVGKLGAQHCAKCPGPRQSSSERPLACGSEEGQAGWLAEGQGWQEVTGRPPLPVQRPVPPVFPVRRDLA